MEGLPASNRFDLVGAGKAVTAVDADANGARLVCGSHDYKCYLYDFGGLKADGKSFRSWEVTEGYPVVAVSWSPTGDAFLVVTSYSQPKVYNRDGKELGELPKGDMYIRDMKNTKGHVTNCTGGVWHPVEKTTALTSSEDGTLRVWDVMEVQQKTVIKPQLAKPGRVSVTSCSYSTDGRLIAAGLADGTIQLWDVKGKFGHSAAVGLVPVPKPQQALFTKQTWTYATAPGQVVRNAHSAGSDITCVRFSLNGQHLLSRSEDGSLKLWDLRKFKTPLCTADDLPCNYSMTQACYSPDEKFVLTGTSAEGKDSSGSLVMLDAQTLEKQGEIAVDGSAVAVQWHPRINQIFVGCGGRGGGCVRTFYDPKLSSKGALAAASRAPRVEATEFMSLGAPKIYVPNALPMYREDLPGRPLSKKRRAEKEAEDRKYQPAPGSQAKGVGAGGQLGATGGTLLTQHVLKQQGGLANAEVDARAAFLRHANKNDDQISRFTAAYKATQPAPIFAEEEEDEEQAEQK
ncbi:WD repeat-containing 70 [Chlorella sorokiniana]|uniref:WD repeat-containing 70 n=1 Tax=Chlorella sorokiniana TaxID=3076 RepID=A0A2P6TDK5_CHLSO|nr:WD repeat-containing 70 [Chlorella sorokiniana]|eukprot:PRW20712.1 WD repeat-containing 70 [Chlorella sorokiniana]